MTALFSAVTAGICLICTAICVWNAVGAARAAASQERRLRSLESAVRSHSSLLDESKELLESLANKVKMQRVRNVIAHGQEPRGKMPDPYKDPDAWRKAMNSKLSAGRTAASE